RADSRNVIVAVLQTIARLTSVYPIAVTGSARHSSNVSDTHGRPDHGAQAGPRPLWRTQFAFGVESCGTELHSTEMRTSFEGSVLPHKARLDIVRLAGLDQAKLRV